ncbi:holin [Microbacterium sp. 3J1]|uniref:holin n=1 Tax=Microbacterium sp. 3J1 TaxID=861269 RepID=UPI000A9BEE0D|nr:holin [Microbacterium sp. 3J1]
MHLSLLTNRAWWRSAGLRALYTAIAIGLPYVGGALIADIAWLTAASAALLGFLASLATSLAGLPETEGVNLPWWLAAVERVVKTFAQALAAGFLGATLLADVAWSTVLQAAIIAAFTSLLRLILATLPNDPTPTVVLAQVDDGSWRLPEETVGVDVEQVADLATQERYPLRRDRQID